jgi:alpha-glucosidase
VGDLRGIADRVDHLSWLGVDAIWLSPIHPSPDVDWGYDVSDYLDVHPDLGTLADFAALMAAARARGIRVILDLVPNHTSDRHPWFVRARAGRDAPGRDWYVWADPAAGGGPPNNWQSVFGGPAWSLDPASGQYWLHNFAPEQPDLDWWNPAVRAAFEDILRFWLDRGVDGFRIDVCHGLVKDRLLRDNPPGDPQPAVYNMNRPEVHDVLRAWRRVADAYPHQPVLLGETVVDDLNRLGAFYGDGDQLHLAMNFPFLTSPFTAPALRSAVTSTLAALPTGAWPVWTASNHDRSRAATRWAGDDPRGARLALLLLLTLRGTPLLYYGDEIGMPDVAVPPERVRDRCHRRDRSRTPMQWAPGPGAGFTRPGTAPWLPIGDAARVNVEDQRARPGSPLLLARDLIRLRRERPELRRAPMRFVPEAPHGVLAYRRGGLVVAMNLTHDEAPAPRGAVMRATDPAAAGVLGPWEGAVVDSGGAPGY